MKRYLQNLFNLQENTDFEKTIATISKGVSLRGYNLWILVCAAVLASIGLDTNSTAIIIGAMLISPLMSPILGVGLSLAIHDKKLLSRSVKNLCFAVMISLMASILYFWLSPLGEVTPQMQARTFPTLLDVLVALFGGVAGIVSISRHEQTNAIPGVAIATALMPPLCTAGFGIATANWDYFLGAFYLFVINAIFISLATYLIARYLHFPENEQAVFSSSAKRYRTWFIIISFIALTPSIYFLYTVYKQELVKEDINNLVILPIKKQGNEILKWETVNRDSTILIKVYHSGKQLNDTLKNSIDSALAKHQMSKYRLVSMRVNLTKEEVSELSAEMTKQMFQEMHLDELKQQSLKNENPPDTLSYTQLTKKIKAVFPLIDTAYNGWLTIPDSLNRIDTIATVFFSTKKHLSKAQSKQLYNFLLITLNTDTVQVFQVK